MELSRALLGGSPAVFLLRYNYVNFRASRYRDKTQLPLSCHPLPRKNTFTNTVQNVTEEFIISRYRKTNYRAKSGVSASSGYRGVNFRNNDITPITARK